MKAKAPSSSKNAQVPLTIAVMTRELGAKDADSADGPEDEEVTGGDVVNDRELGAKDADSVDGPRDKEITGGDVVNDRELESKDADSVDGPGDEEITGGDVVNDRVVIDDGGVIKDSKIVDTALN